MEWNYPTKLLTNLSRNWPANWTDQLANWPTSQQQNKLLNVPDHQGYFGILQGIDSSRYILLRLFGMCFVMYTFYILGGRKDFPFCIFIINSILRNSILLKKLGVC